MYTLGRTTTAGHQNGSETDVFVPFGLSPVLKLTGSLLTRLVQPTGITVTSREVIGTRPSDLWQLLENWVDDLVLQADSPVVLSIVDPPPPVTSTGTSM